MNTSETTNLRARKKPRTSFADRKSPHATVAPVENYGTTVARNTSGTSFAASVAAVEATDAPT